MIYDTQHDITSLDFLSFQSTNTEINELKSVNKSLQDENYRLKEENKSLKRTLDNMVNTFFTTALFTRCNKHHIQYWLLLYPMFNHIIAIDLVHGLR